MKISSYLNFPIFSNFNQMWEKWHLFNFVLLFNNPTPNPHQKGKHKEK